MVKFDGGLLVYAPVAPTVECLQLLNELVEIHGAVRYIILSTISGLEHKVFVGPFARCFPQAEVWVAPDQWSFPFDLPLSWLGVPSDRTYILPADSSKTPFGDEFDYAMLDTIDLGPGQFGEVAVYHKRSRTLLVTDTIVSIPSTPPDIVAADPYPLLFHARDRASDELEDTITHRIEGWQRICLFALYFRPSSLEVAKWSSVFRESFAAVDRSKRGYFGLYPFRWQSGWESTFEMLRGDGRLLVAPILQKVILNRAPKETIEWVDRITEWDFQRIVPCHFDAPITATGQDFRQAFAFLEDSTRLGSDLAAADFQLIDRIESGLTGWGIIDRSR